MRNLRAFLFLILFSNISLAQLVAIDDTFSIPSSGVLLVEAFGVLANDSVDGETEVDGMEATLLTGVSFGSLECVVREGDTIISRTPGICADGSFDYAAGNAFSGTDSFSYQVDFPGYSSQDANVDISACSSGPLVFTCWKDAPYLAKLSELGYNVFTESFEGLEWDVVRNESAPSITNHSIIWTTNFPNINNITTGGSTAVSGVWVGYDANHGYSEGTPGICDIDNPPEMCLLHDGLSGNSDFVLYALGAYVSSPVPASANISIFIDGTPHNIGKMPGHGYDFFGVIDTHGFQDFQFTEVDGKIGQENPIFMDDFIIATLEPVLVNTAPTLMSMVDVTIDEGQYIALDFSASDPDDGDSLFFAVIDDLPVGANFDDYFDGTAGFNWRPSFSQAGEYPLSINVTDNGFPPMSDTMNFQITVLDVPELDLIFKDGFEF